MQTLQAGSGVCVLSCGLFLECQPAWPPCAPRLSLLMTHFCVSSAFSIVSRSPPVAILVFCGIRCRSSSFSGVSRSCPLTFEQCGIASCERGKLSKVFTRALTVTHLFTRDGFSPTSSRTRSPLRWIALPPILLRASHLSPLSLPSLSEK